MIYIRESEEPDVASVTTPAKWEADNPPAALERGRTPGPAPSLSHLYTLSSDLEDEQLRTPS